MEFGLGLSRGRPGEEQFSLLMRIATTESVSSCAPMKG
jgi:hypothetical protein